MSWRAGWGFVVGAIASCALDRPVNKRPIGCNWPPIRRRRPRQAGQGRARHQQRARRGHQQQDQGNGEDGLRLPQHRQPRGPAHAQVRRLPAPAPGSPVEGEEEGHEGSEERSVGKSERSVCIFGIVPDPCQLCGGCRKLQIDYLRIVLIHA